VSDPDPLKMTEEPFRPNTFSVRYTGILTGVGLIVMALSWFLLPPRPATFFGGLALILVFVAGSCFLFLIATLVSLALEGRRRMQFQIAVSLAVPLLFTLWLASRADAVPLETLWRMLTPWLLWPLGIIAWISWHAGCQLRREHPFRGFVIAAAIIGVVCLFWSAGMTSETDYDGEGSDWFLDPEKAKRARETGEYVWRFILYVTTAYLGLFFKFRQRLRVDCGSQ
jgi:hypothetical protein